MTLNNCLIAIIGVWSVYNGQYSNSRGSLFISTGVEASMSSDGGWRNSSTKRCCPLLEPYAWSGGDPGTLCCTSTSPSLFLCAAANCGRFNSILCVQHFLCIFWPQCKTTMIIKQIMDTTMDIRVDSFSKISKLNSEAALLTLLNKNRLARKTDSNTLRYTFL